MAIGRLIILGPPMSISRSTWRFERAKSIIRRRARLYTGAHMTIGERGRGSGYHMNYNAPLSENDGG